MARRTAALAQRRQQPRGPRGLFRRYIDAWRSILTLARRPDDEEWSLLSKLTLLGFLLVGGIAYIIRLVATLLSS